MHVHGGGPAICREELDVYSGERSLETELYLDEVRGKGAADFARRLSWQFVDECYGDMEAWGEKYCGGAETDVVAVEGKLSAAELLLEKRVSHDDPGGAGKSRGNPAEDGAAHRVSPSSGSVRRRQDDQMPSKQEDEGRRRARAALAEKEKQLSPVRIKFQKSLARQRELRDAVAQDDRQEDTDKALVDPSRGEDLNAQLAQEIQKGRQLQLEVEQLEHELFEERKTLEEPPAGDAGGRSAGPTRVRQETLS